MFKTLERPLMKARVIVVELPLPFETPEEILDGGAEDFVTVLDNLAFRGLKTLVVGQSKAGKSFMLWIRCAEAVTAGHRVLYLSEEPKETVADKLKRFGLDKAGDAFRVLRRSHPDLRDLTWKQMAEKLGQAVRAGRYDAVVVDTARPWLGLEGDASNSADIIGPAIDALSSSAEAGAAVVVLHQSPWSSKRARNSTEFHAASDLIFHVEGEGTEARTVKYVGGRVEQVPEVQTFRWTPEKGPEDLGRLQHRTATRLDTILRTLEDADHPLPADEIVEATEFSIRSVQRDLTILEGEGRVLRQHGQFTQGGREPDKWSRTSPEAEAYGASYGETETGASDHLVA